MARLTSNYAVTCGAWQANSGAPVGDRQLLSLLVERDMDAPGGRCELELAGAGFPPPAAGADVTVKLDSGGGLQTVFTGAVSRFATSPVGQRVLATDGLARLCTYTTDAAFEDQTAGDIIKTLIEGAGASAGRIESGPSLPAYVIHSDRRAWGHARHLAALCGADLFTDADGKVHCALPEAGPAAISFRWGVNVVDLDLRAADPSFDSVVVWGEGAAGAKGADKAHWLPGSLDGVRGAASLGTDGAIAAGKAGKRPRMLTEAALRAGQDAEKAAQAMVAALAGRRVHGRLTVYGAPEVGPGDRVDITELPSDHAASALLQRVGTLRVRSIRHTLDRERGFVTRLEF